MLQDKFLQSKAVRFLESNWDETGTEQDRTGKGQNWSCYGTEPELVQQDGIWIGRN